MKRKMWLNDMQYPESWQFYAYGQYMWDNSHLVLQTISWMVLEFDKDMSRKMETKRLLWLIIIKWQLKCFWLITRKGLEEFNTYRTYWRQKGPRKISRDLPNEIGRIKTECDNKETHILFARKSHFSLLGIFKIYSTTLGRIYFWNCLMASN